MKVVKLRGGRKIKSLPLKITIPPEFVRRNNIQAGDRIDMYLTENGELIVKKRES